MKEMNDGLHEFDNLSQYMDQNASMHVFRSVYGIFKEYALT